MYVAYINPLHPSVSFPFPSLLPLTSLGSTLQSVIFVEKYHRSKFVSHCDKMMLIKELITVEK
jgi:hypothetical protein